MNNIQLLDNNKFDYLIDSSSSDSEDEVTARLTSLKLSDNSVPLSKRDERRMKKHKKKKVPEKDNVNVEETVMKKESMY